jgi:ribA/ribD-fused uncharacterized protein
VIINSFQGKYAFLSNFYPATLEYNGTLYPTSEHAYQASKTNSKLDRDYIASRPTPGQAKKAGQFVQHRPYWEDVKVPIMREIVYLKFAMVHNEHLKKMLLATEDVQLVEGNTWGDVYWGVCKGQGANLLGKILMQVRKDLS